MNFIKKKNFKFERDVSRFGETCSNKMSIVYVRITSRYKYLSRQF